MFFDGADSPFIETVLLYLNDSNFIPYFSFSIEKKIITSGLSENEEEK